MGRFLAIGVVVAAGCASGRFPADTESDAKLVPADGLIEFGVDADGGVTEVEFHVPWTALPAEVRGAADREMPGGKVLDCEKEYTGKRVLWEVTKQIGGKDQEVLFDSSGKAVEWEVEVDPKSVPAEVLAAADRAIAGSRTKVEEIRGSDRNLVEYHVKKTDRGFRYKLAIGADGKVRGIWRETRAEIEVLVD